MIARRVAKEYELRHMVDDCRHAAELQSGGETPGPGEGRDLATMGLQNRILGQ